MAMDIIARGLATSLIGLDGKVASDKMPVISGTSDLGNFVSIGHLTDSSLIEGRTTEEILLMMLYGIVNPTFTLPNLSIALNDENTALIIGQETVLNGTLVFDQGKIEPAFGTSGKRAGAPIYYTIKDSIINTTSTQYDFSISFTPTERENILNYGVCYSTGEQPLNSIGQIYDQPYAAGNIINSITLKAAYALYNNKEEKLQFSWFEDEDGEGYLTMFATETADHKQNFMVSADMTVVGIKAFNPLTQQWEWLGGETAAYSLTYFDTTAILGDSIGESTNYILYTHNQARTGERELRIYIQ